jgi:hypothetical protein
VLVVIPDAGHYPHETAPAQLLVAMEAFLASTTPFQYSEADWTELLTAPQKQSPSAGSTETALVRGVRRGEVMGARRIIDMATGALMELRGCSETEAVRELVLAGRETGLGTQRIARALVNGFADENGRVTDPDRVAAVGRGRPLLDARADAAPRDDPAVVSTDITILYGGVND